VVEGVEDACGLASRVSDFQLVQNTIHEREGPLGKIKNRISGRGQIPGLEEGGIAYAYAYAILLFTPGQRPSLQLPQAHAFYPSESCKTSIAILLVRKEAGMTRSNTPKPRTLMKGLRPSPHFWSRPV